MQTISLSIRPQDMTLPDILFIVDTVLINIRRLKIENHRFAREGFLEAICECDPKMGRRYLANLQDGNSFSIPLEIQSQNGVNFSSSEYQVNVDLSSLPLENPMIEEYLFTVREQLETYFGG